MNAAARVPSALPAHKCPLCGHAIDRDADPHFLLRELPLGPISRRIVDRLLQSFGSWVLTEQLLAAAYGDDPNGGPNTPKIVIKVTISRLRPTLARLGYAVEFTSVGLRRLVRR